MEFHEAFRESDLETWLFHNSTRMERLRMMKEHSLWKCTKALPEDSIIYLITNEYMKETRKKDYINFFLYANFIALYAYVVEYNDVL